MGSIRKFDRELTILDVIIDSDMLSGLKTKLLDEPSGQTNSEAVAGLKYRLCCHGRGLDTLRVFDITLYSGVFILAGSIPLLFE